MTTDGIDLARVGIMADNVMDRVLVAAADTGIRREDRGRWVAGVCVGLGRRWGVDPVLMRVGFLLLTVLGGLGSALYLLCWLLLPGEDSSIALERALRRGDGGAVTLLVITAIAVVGALTSDVDGWPVSYFGLAVLGVLVWFITRRGRTGLRPDAAAASATAAASQVSYPPPPGSVRTAPEMGIGTAAAPGVVGNGPVRPLLPVFGAPTDRVPGDRGAVPPASTPPAAPVTPGPMRRVSWAASLLVLGLATLTYLVVDVLTYADADGWMIPAAASLVVLGGGLVITAATRRRPPLVTPAAWALAVGLVVSLVVGGPQPAGEVVWRPTTAAEVQGQYESGLGDSLLDLTAVPVEDGVRTIRVDQGVGDLEIRLPAGVSASVRSTIGVGALRIQSGRTREVRSGTGVDATATVGTGPLRYDLEITHGAGEVVVVVTDTPVSTTSDGAR